MYSKNVSVGRRGFLSKGLALAGVGPILFPLDAAGAVSDPSFAEDVTTPSRSWGRGPISGLPWHSGGYSLLDHLVQARNGRGLDLVQNFPNNPDWSQIENIGRVPKWIRTVEDHEPIYYILSFPPFPKNDPESPKHDPMAWKRAASGEFNDRWKKAAESLRDTTPGNCIVRVGWEFNGTSFPWTVHGLDGKSGQQQWYIDGFRHCVDMLRKHWSSSITISWCRIKNGKQIGNVSKYFPGKDHVDIIGLDYYDVYSPQYTLDDWEVEARRINRNNEDDPIGIEAHLEMSRSLDLPMSVDEWGISCRDRNTDQACDPSSGGDNPIFIEGMHRFLERNAASVAYECYFNTSGGHQIGGDPSPNPKATEAYRSLWGADEASAPRSPA